MSTRLCRIFLAAGLWTGSVWAQGSLTPPGAPAPTMKTLGQIESRTPITNLPYNIDQPGSYYLVTNLTSAIHGITINTNGVVLDLMGFAITGDRGVTDCGVYIGGTDTAPICGTVVRNGTLRNFGIGLRANSCHGGRFEQLALSSNSASGVWFYGSHGTCIGNVISNCAVVANSLDGINLSGSMGECIGNTVVDCAVVENGSAGIRLYGYGDLVYDTRCDGNTIVRCTVSGNSDEGIFLDGSYHGRCDGNVVADCAVSDNGNYGLTLNGSASGRCQGNTISGCAVNGNGAAGISITGNPAGTCNGNAVVGCVVRANRDYGIYLYLARGNRVEGNHVSGQTYSSYGIDCNTTASNLFLCNSGIGQVDNYVLGASDTYGPTVTNTGELATSGKPAHPWANFSR